MSSEDLFAKGLDAADEEGAKLGAGVEPELGQEGGDWSEGTEAGSDLDLQRSEEAVALSELLRENGLAEGSIDALLQGIAMPIC